jgi:DNA processing protein
VAGLEDRRLVSSDEAERAMSKAGVVALLRGSPGYPTRLDSIPDPPDLLFVRGTIPELPTVAVVGTRTRTAYGRALAESFGRAIAAAGWCLVSGLARGIDGDSHRGTLDAGGVGVGVLGSGPDVPYPREHRTLMDRLAMNGAIVTEYPPGTPPNGWRFPPRNRIISGLSSAVVIVEAGITGGALSTAARALDQGRDLFAVPGDIDRASSVGCNLLIRDGAVPVLGPDDLIEALSLVLGPPALRSSDPEVPATGLSVDEVGEQLGLRGAALLAWIGRRQVLGALRLEGGRVYPQVVDEN